MTFKVDRTPAVSRLIRELAERAKARRIRESYLDALNQMMTHLTNRPLEWGDPEFNTQLPGGIVCHGIVWPVCVRFAVYEAQRIVVIFDLKPLPRTPLAEP